MSKQPISNWEDRKQHLSFWWATVGGVGLLKPAPGTWGSFAALIAGYMLIDAGASAAMLLAAVALITVVSMRAIDDIEAKSGIHDAPEIVIDEVAGQWIALLPLLYFPSSYLAYGIAFVLFRIFDIIKPWPIGPLDRKVSGGFGVMIDDIVAGCFAALILYALLYFHLLQ